MSIHKKIKAHIRAHLEKRHQHHHNMDNQPPIAQTPTISTNKPFFGKIKIYYILLFLGVVIVIGGGIFFYTQQKQTSTNKQAVTHPQGAIAKVSEEYIYQSDLNFELNFAPPQKDVDLKKQLLAKIVEDSIILQGAKTDGLATLDSSTYNSPSKDYSKRVALIKQIRETIEKSAVKRTGSVVAIWFDNTKPGPVGYEKGKQIALAKITKLQADVKAKKITMQQAADQIKADSSLAQIDPSYRNNAILNFSAETNKLITFDKTFSDMMWQLQPGEVSDVFLAKDREIDSPTLVDAVYLFGQVDKIAAGSIISFDDWFSKKKGLYAVKYY